MHALFILVLWLVNPSMTPAVSTHDGPCARQWSAAGDAAAVAEFAASVRGYLLLRQEAARMLPTEQPFDDPRDMLIVRDALKRAIRDARPGAKAGDLFTAGAATAFRHIIAATAAAQRVDLEDVVRALSAERWPDAKEPAVNASYDWRLGAWMWPALLQRLPPLPAELEYRIVDKNLVLIDLRASLVVDILEDAMEADEDCPSGDDAAR